MCENEGTMIRQAIPEDIPAITALIRAEEGMWQDAWADDVLDRAIKSSDGLAYVWDDGSVRAFVCAHDVGFRGYLSDLIVAKDARRKGIARRLVLRVQEELANRGCHLLISDVWHEAEPFYQALGWAPVTSLVKLLRKELRHT
jgi:ribosomal protein S18 acetylase RimI-like enzyme